jgi:phosphatidylserine decarboxylase
MTIKYYNRVTNQIEEEKVYGAALVNWMYKSQPGKALSFFLCKAPISKAYGFLQDLPTSKDKIPEFISDYNIQINDFLPEEGRSEKNPYSSFNKFFIRKFKAHLRPFIENQNEMGAFAEARYYGFSSVSPNEKIPVKGNYLAAKGLINNYKWNEVFQNGPLLLARLCPVDYHRFHFPDNCKIIDEFRIPGLYHSVNPVAIHEKEDIFITNERHVTILETENFGKLAYIEVGAICVGKIVQSKKLILGSKHKKGDEKGYFLFGGSTVIVLGEPGKWTPSNDILENTKNGLETYLQLGMSVATNGK